MGHTLVATFDEERIRALLLEPYLLRCNKIPYGRDCDRTEANAVLPFHLTLMHWAKESDPTLLPRLEFIHPQQASIRIRGAGILAAEERSHLLYLKVSPGSGFQRLSEHLEEKVGRSASRFLHITLAADQDHRLIRMLHDHVKHSARFPFELEIKALELYHIWTPTRLVRSFGVNSE